MTTPTPTRRAAVYLRVSTDRQTTENQCAEVRQMVHARGYEQVLYEDVESAAKARLVFDGMIADVRAGRVHAVAVWALDRLHRSMNAPLVGKRSERGESRQGVPQPLKLAAYAFQTA